MYSKNSEYIHATKTGMIPSKKDTCPGVIGEETTIPAARTDSELRNKRAGEAEEDERAYDKVVNTYTGEENPKREREREI